MKVIVVGGVAGGAGAAARLRRNDEKAEIILFERGGFISFANCGLPYYIGGTISNEADLLLQTPESFHRRFRVDVRVRHAVTAVDPAAHTVTVRDAAGKITTERYDALILSPGARPVVPPLPGVDRQGVFSLRNMEDCQTIAAYIQSRKPQSAAVIGAGFVGVEMAENLRRRGMQVTLIEALPQVMGLDPDIAAEIHNHIREKGVDLRLEAKATAINAHSVSLEHGEVPADLVIVSVGVAPDTGFLAGSGITLGAKGEILVDDAMRTSQPDVYAVGDAVSIPHCVDGRKRIVPLAAPANKQARLAADVVSGTKRTYAGTQGTAIAKVFDMAAAVTGLGENELRRQNMAYAKSITQSPSHAGYYPGATMLTIKLLFHPENGLLYGAQAIGRDGVDKRIDVLATALRAGMTVFDLQKLDLAYAPPFSSAKDPVNTAGYVAGNILEGRSRPIYVEDLDHLAPGSVFLDIRTREEYAAGAIPGTVNIPLDELREHIHTLNPGNVTYVTCQVGLRGHVGAEILRNHGFDVRNLIGGYRLYDQIRRDKEARKQ